MTELLKKFDDIMIRYSNGEFGSKNLTMYEILEKAGDVDLFNKMTLIEIDTLINQSSGFMKHFFIQIKRDKIETFS